MQAPTKYELVINPWTVRKTLEVDGYLWGFLAGARGRRSRRIPDMSASARRRPTGAHSRYSHPPRPGSTAGGLATG